MEFIGPVPVAGHRTRSSRDVIFSDGSGEMQIMQRS